MISVFDHLQRYGKEVIVPTERMVRHWFSRLNDELFDSALNKPALVSMDTGKDAWMAAFEPATDDTFTLYFAPNPMSRAAFLEILAHEMVHAAVWFLDGNHYVMHGPAFMAYAGTLAVKAGLPLRDGFYGEPEELCS
jgi:SprT-like family